MKINLKTQNQNLILKENKNFENSINKLSEELNNLKEEFKNYKNNYLNLCWPIGSYYLTNNNINPEKLFGEKWQKIEGKFLYAADNNRKVDSTGIKKKLLCLQMKCLLMIINHKKEEVILKQVIIAIRVLMVISVVI